MQQLPPKSRTEYEQDRRCHVRYAVEGTAEVDAAGTKYAAIPVEISLGGITFKTEQSPPPDQVLKLKLAVYGFSELIFAEIRVIRADSKKTAAIFLAPGPSLARCISWLSGYNKQVPSTSCT